MSAPRVAALLAAAVIVGVLLGLGLDLAILWAISTRPEAADLFLPVTFTAALLFVVVAMRRLARGGVR